MILRNVIPLFKCEQVAKVTHITKMLSQYKYFYSQCSLALQLFMEDTEKANIWQGMHTQDF